MSEGFLGRWAKRKEAVRRGQEVAAEPEVVAKPLPSPQPSPASGRGSEEPVTSTPLSGERGAEGRPAETEPAPTLADTENLTIESDFTRFVRPDVAPDVKNAAFRKLFADPHFNVMDRLDTYIDDYNKPDPLPPEMLRQMTSAKFLGLFDDEGEQEDRAAAAPGEVADDPAAQTVAQSQSRTEQALPPAEDHADPDLRLQQDDAPGPAGPGAGAR
jgi:hypothetical protein